MINFKITNSLDLNAIGEFEFHTESITIGNENSNCDLILFDESLTTAHVKIFENVNDPNKDPNTGSNFFIIEPIDNSPVYLNNKKLTSARTLSIGDIVKLGKTTISILKFSNNSNDTNNKNILSKKIDKDIYEIIERSI